MDDHWFLRQSRKEAQDIICNAQMGTDTKRELIKLISARIEGFSMALSGDPLLYREFCDCRGEMRKLLESLHWANA